MFGLDDVLLGMAVSGGTGLLGSLFSGESERSKGLKALKRRLGSIQQLTRTDIDSELSSIDRAAKSQAVDYANQSATSTAGRQNAMSIIMSRMAPAVAQARMGRESELNDYNRRLPFEKLQASGSLNALEDTDTPQMDAMNVISMGLQAASMSAMGKAENGGSPFSLDIKPMSELGLGDPLSLIRKRRRSFNQLGF